MKLSRHSQETYIDEKNKQRYVKLKPAKIAKSKSFPVAKLTLKGKCYQNASCLIEYGDCILEEHTYTGVRVTLKDRYYREYLKNRCFY